MRNARQVITVFLLAALPAVPCAAAAATKPLKVFILGGIGRGLAEAMNTMMEQ